MQQKINILLVDDEALFVNGLILLLKKFNIKTIALAENGQRALALLKTIKPDVILLDLEMPLLNGSKTLDNIKQRFPYCKVIIISTYHNEQLIKDCLNRGAKAFVSKKENIETVVSAIRAVKAGGIYIDYVPALLKIRSPKDRHYYKLIFSTRELEIMAQIISDKTLGDTAAELFLSEKTVEGHLTKIYKKLEVKNRTQFIKYVTKEGLEYLRSPPPRKIKNLNSTEARLVFTPILSKHVALYYAMLLN